MILKIFERPKIIIDYLFQAEHDLNAVLLSNQNSSIPANFSLDLMSFALRCYEIILNNFGDIFRTHLPLKEFVQLSTRHRRDLLTWHDRPLLHSRKSPSVPRRQLPGHQCGIFDRSPHAARG
jgi:hypothetical protein